MTQLIDQQIMSERATSERATSEPALNEKVARGFALYVGVSEAQAQAAGLSLGEVAAELRATLERLVPGGGSQSYAAVALAPASAQGGNLEITRRALGEPRAVRAANPETDSPASGVVVDLTRRKVFVDGAMAGLTCKEFEMLKLMIQREGETVARRELNALGAECRDAGEPAIDLTDVLGDARNNSGEVLERGGRAVDVHIRRLRSKLGGYEDIVRTVRGVGYRFDAHPDVLVEA
jgi:DNA-binding response OmpR family regulator